jgi:hypothetical protein
MKKDLSKLLNKVDNFSLVGMMNLLFGLRKEINSNG